MIGKRCLTGFIHGAFSAQEHKICPVECACLVIIPLETYTLLWREIRRRRWSLWSWWRTLAHYSCPCCRDSSVSCRRLAGETGSVEWRRRAGGLRPLEFHLFWWNRSSQPPVRYFLHFSFSASWGVWTPACDDLHGKLAKVNSWVAKVWLPSLLAFSAFVGSPMMVTWQSQSMRDARGQSFHIGRFRRLSTMPTVEIVEASVQTKPFPTLEMVFGDPWDQLTPSLPPSVFGDCFTFCGFRWKLNQRHSYTGSWFCWAFSIYGDSSERPSSGKAVTLSAFQVVFYAWWDWWLYFLPAVAYGVCNYPLQC
jgi:hypothetical protein